MMDNDFSDASLQIFFNRTIKNERLPVSAKTKHKSKPKPPSPVTLRLTPGERRKLEELAQGMTLSAYIRICVLQNDTAPRKSSTRAPVKDHEALGRILGLLGQSRLANNLNQLAKAANIGALPVDDSVQRDLHEACAYVSEIRALLIGALGLKEAGR